MPPPWARFLGEGAFEACRMYLRGTITAEQYRAVLADYPRLVFAVGALAVFRRLESTDGAAAGRGVLLRHLRRNRALAILCRTLIADDRSGRTVLLAACPRETLEF